MKGLRVLLFLSVVVIALGSAQSTASKQAPVSEPHHHSHEHHDHEEPKHHDEVGHDHHDHDHDEHEHEDHAHTHDDHEHEHHDHEEHEHHDEVGHDHHDHVHEEHEHEHDHAHDDHEDHDHEGHDHDSHDHAHEEHEHDDHEHQHEDHDHAHETHNHAHEGHNHADPHDHKHGDHSGHADHGHHAHGHHGHSHGKGDAHKCPFHSQHKHEERAVRSTVQDNKQPSTKSSQSWLYAIGATLFISAAPVAILPFVPLDRTAEKKPFLNVLLSFAVGGLLGDVFLHLLPHSMTPHDHSDHAGHDHHGHDHGAEGGEGEDLSVGLYVLAGILTFFLVEKFVRANGHSHSHGGHSHGSSKKKSGKEKVETKKGEKKDTKESKNVETEAEEIKTGGWLNLVADATHNFTDGLALASSFQAGTAIGLTTTVAVLLHEIPHEIGDFAILLQSGFPRKKAMYLQFATGFGALAGCFTGLLAEGFGSFFEIILPFTAGGFIYIATVNVIPELLEDTNLWQSVKEAFAACAGVALMVLVAKLEHSQLFEQAMFA